MQRDKVTLCAGVPTMYFALLHHPTPDRSDPASLRFRLAGGAREPSGVCALSPAALDA